MPTRLADRMLKLVFGPLIGRIDAWEDGVAAMPEAHRSVEDSPVRFEILREKMKRKGGGPDPTLAALMPPTILGVRTSMQSLRSNPPRPKSRVPDGFSGEFERYARTVGVSSIGYTQVPERWIFRDKAILHLNAIMLTMEMDKVRIDTAPSVAGAQAVFEIYRDLGIAANRIAAYLRQREIYTSFRYYPLHRIPLYGATARLPQAEDAADSTLCIPLHQSLTSSDLELIAQAIREFA